MDHALKYIDYGPCMDHVWTMYGPCMDHVFTLALASFSRGVKLAKSEGHSLFFTLHFSLANRAK